MSRTSFAALAAALAVATPAAADPTALPAIDVESGAGPASAETLTKDDISAVRSSDTGALLSRIPGVSAYGAGGFSSLPTIRGLNGPRLSIRVDGAPIDSACPNDMNPPLSYTDPQTIDAMSVITGVSPVSMGGDSIGGIISVETATPRFAAAGQTLVTGEVSTFYRSNGDGFGGAASLTIAGDKTSFTYDGSFTQSDNYKGGGNDGTVRSTEYKKTDHTIGFAANTEAGLFTLKGGYHFSPYEGFPNQYMDMTSNRSWFLNGGWKGTFDWGDIDLRAYWRDTDHRMNFLADKGGTAGGGMPMNTEVHTLGYTLKTELPLSARDTLRLGNEFHHQWLDDYWPPVAGSMMMGPDTYINVNASKRDRIGTFAEWEARWSPAFTTTIGVRNDQVWMNTGDVQPYSTSMMNMDDAMAAMAFNAADHKRHDSNWGWSAIARYAASDRATLEIGYARKVRSPNVYERYSWGRGSMSSRMIGWYGDGNGYVGNLALKPEKADTLSAALSLKGEGESWSLKIAPHYTRVDDYIDAVKLQDFTDMMGMPTPFAQLQFANQDAEFYGVDVSGALPLWASSAAGKAKLTASASWLRGKNRDDGGPLYHQMPLNARIGLEHSLGGWESLIEVELVDDKTRVDTTRNEPVTDSYALVNISTGYRFAGYRISVDVQNLFDTGYALPLGGKSLGDYGETGVLRPVPGRGRSVNVGLSASF
jgi:iron complex outermembrane receptor protein